MAKVLTDSQNYTDIANAIREKAETTATYKPSEMAVAIQNLSGGIPCTLTVTTSPNATVTATLDGTTLTATADSNGVATFVIEEEGVWTVSATDGVSENSVEVNTAYALSTQIGLVGTLEETPWNLISTMAKAGLASQFWSIGDTKTYTCNGVTYTAQIIGFDHDDVTDSASYGRTKAGITFQNVEIIDRTTYVFSGKTQYWDTAYIKTSQFNNFYIPNIPSEMAAAMVAVNKQFKNASSYSSTTMSTCSDTVFLLSYREIFGTTGTITSAAAEGTRYAFYAAGNSRIKKLVSGTAENYSTRSLSGKESSTNYYVYIDESGNASTTKTPQRWVPAFCV